jgi:flagellar export protein FliJ
MLKPRACWSVLLTKAQDEVDRIQGELQQIRLRAQSLEASRERLLNLYADYQQAPATGSTSAGMQDTMNRRQFAAQLLTLMDRVKQDIAQVERVMAHTRQRLGEAEKERLKMQALVEQDLNAVRKDAAVREQRQMDELGVMQFNLGNSA